MITNAADLYDLTVSRLLPLKKDGRVWATNIVNGVEQSKQIPFEQVLFAIGIRFVGATVAKILARQFGSIQNLMQASFDELKNTDEIGDKIAQSIIDYFAEDGNRLFVNRLIGYGLQFEMKRQEAKSAKLAGLTIIASGKLEHFSRDEINRAIEEHGGKPVTSVSSKTDYLIAGENIGPNKLAKARELGIPIITEAEFLQMIADDGDTSPQPAEPQEEKPAEAKPKNDGPVQMSLF